MIVFRQSIRFSLCLLAVLTASVCVAETQSTARLQYDMSISQLEDHDLFTEVTSDQPHEHHLQTRLMLDARQNGFGWSLHYELQASDSDRLLAARALATIPLLSDSAGIDDATRLFDLSHELHTEDETLLLHRLDRLYLGHNGPRLSWKLGRYAVSWGNGLAYSVMDVFNPFDPASIDKEYKTGDDMLYLQYLTASGNDVQLLLVPRREATSRSLRADQSSLAIKYHALAGNIDYDLLLARHYDENLFGAGFAWDIEGVLWRGDVMLARAAQDDFVSMLTSVSYAWSWYEKPMSGFVEAYYNEVGEDYDGSYQLSDIGLNTALLQRLSRGEVYTLGQTYMALGLDVELHPLVRLRPTVFANLDDHSRLHQLLVQYDVRQNISLMSGVNILSGKRGSEYGGIETGVANTTLSAGDSWFLLVNTYF